jgi:hypothetical protein
MREVEDQYLKAMLGPETLTLIKTASVENIVIEAQELARKAIVALQLLKLQSELSLLQIVHLR